MKSENLSEAEFLEAILSITRFDTYYHQSDDHRHWKEQNDLRRKIVGLTDLDMLINRVWVLYNRSFVFQKDFVTAIKLRNGKFTRADVQKIINKFEENIHA